MSEYIHGYSRAEQARLSRMQEILNDAELSRLDLGDVRSVLDVGCGLGQMTRRLARAAGPGARVVGVERDERQLERARLLAREAGEETLVELRRGEAEALPLAAGERGAFDLVHTRFLLEHVRDPLAVVREMVAAARPGGRIVLVDDDHELLRLDPELPELARVWEIYWRDYYRLGCDPLVGRRLVSLLRAAGAEPVRLESVFYGACRGLELFDAVVENLAGVLAGAEPGLVAAGALAEGEMSSALAALRAWGADGRATVWYSLPLAEGRRPR